MSENISFKISALDDFSVTMQNLENSLKKVDKVGDSLVSTGKNLTTKVTAPILGIATAAAIVGANFEASMSEVAAISGATGKDLDDLRNIAKEMGESTQFSASESAQALKFMSLAGWDASESVAALPGVLDLAAAGGLELALASDIMTDSMSMFGMTADDATRAADVFAKAQATSNTDVQQLGEALKYSGASARAAGMDIEQTSALLGIFANNGVKGSSAGTTLDAMFRDLKKSVEDGAVAIGDATVAVYDADGAMRPMADVMADIEKATAGMNDETRDAALSSVFQSQALRGVNILMGEGVDAVYELEKGLYGANGAGAEMAGIMNDNISGAFKSMMSAVEGAAISMFEIFAPALRAIIDGITSLIRWFNGLSTTTKTVIAVIAGIAAAIGPLLIGIGIAIKLFALAAPVIKGVGVVLGALASPITLIVVAIGALVAAFIYAYKNVEWFRDMVDAAWAKIKDAFFVALEFVRRLVEKVIGIVADFIGEKLAQITAFWEENGAMITQAAQNVFGWLQSFIEGAMNVILAVFEFVWPAILWIVEGVWDAIKNVVNGAIDVILGVIKFFASLFTGNWSALWDSVKQIISGALELIWGWVQLFGIGRLLKFFGGIASKVVKVFRDLWTNAKGVFFKGLDTISGKVTGVFDKILSFITGLKQSFFNAGKGLIEQIIKGITGMVGKVTDTVKGVAKKIRDFLPFSPAKEGPLSDLDKLDFGGPIADSIAKAQRLVQSGMTTMLELPARPTTTQTAQPTQQSAPINITLNYSGNGSEEDAYRMMGIIERELGLSIQNKNRFSGVRKA